MKKPKNNNCPYAPFDKKCVYQKYSNDLSCYAWAKLAYSMTELKRQMPIIGKYVEPFVCKAFIEESEELE